MRQFRENDTDCVVLSVIKWEMMTTRKKTDQSALLKKLRAMGVERGGMDGGDGTQKEVMEKGLLCVA